MSAELREIEEVKGQTRLGRTYTVWAQGATPRGEERRPLKPVYSFETVEEFWAVYQHLKRPSHLPFFSSLQIFAFDVKPEWEDPNCEDGGRWALRAPKELSTKYWESLLLALIGDQFTAENEVLGVLINVRKDLDAIQVWHRHGRDAAAIDQLKTDLERVFETTADSPQLEYKNFKEELSKPKEEYPRREATWNAPRGGMRGRGK